MKKKLLIVVGAGASVEFGLPSVNEINQLLFKAAFKRWTLAADREQNLYGYIRATINTYYEKGRRPDLRKRANFEEIMYQLSLLATYISDTYNLAGSNALLRALPLPDLLDEDEAVPIHDGMLSGLTRYLSDVIIDECIARCASAATQKSGQIAALNDFLEEMSKEFEIGIVSLNYDNIFTQARPSLFTGFNQQGIFEPEAVFEREPWNFIYHLHGSIHFSTAFDTDGNRTIAWQEVPLTSMHGRTSGGKSLDSMEGVGHLNSVIIAGYGKNHQLLRQPFRTYFAQAQRLVHAADSLLFMGYGFGDVHLNALFSDMPSKRRPCVVVDFGNEETPAFRHRWDHWADGVTQTLLMGRHPSFGEADASSRHVGGLSLRGEFEICREPEFPVAIWYGGFLAACKAHNKLISHLTSET